MSALLPDLAANIAIWFPELKGRALAVSEATITKENMPTLPTCIVALMRADIDHVWQNSRGSIKIADDFIAEFMLETVRYKRADGSETPFWAFYDYEALRNKFFAHLGMYSGPSRERIEIISMEVDSDQYSINISFRLKARVIWCDDVSSDDALDGHDAGKSISTGVCSPRNDYCGPAFDIRNEQPGEVT
jgi:hypothetical protein